MADIDLLRKAAALMRERAQTQGVPTTQAMRSPLARAIADWLNAEADFADAPKNHAEPLPASVIAARAYLGVTQPDREAPASPDLGTGDGEGTGCG